MNSCSNGFIASSSGRVGSCEANCVRLRGNDAVTTGPGPRADDDERPACGFRAVAQADQPGPGRGVDAADTVIPHLDADDVAHASDRHRCGRCSRVLDDVGERLRDDEIRGRLDVAPSRSPVTSNFDGERQSGAECPERPSSP